MSALGARRATAVRDPALIVTSAIAFVASAAATVGLCASMTGGMAMPGGWTMSMAWMKMPGQTWLEAAAMFLVMWVVMMIPMMLPSLVPMLASYRRSLPASDEGRLNALTAIASAGYFFVWSLLGVAAYAVGVGLAAAEMRWESVSRSVPLASGLALLVAAGLELAPWKQRHLRFCRANPACGTAAPGRAGAWTHGIRLGVHCGSCCSSFILILLVLGVMDLAVMAAVAAAITIERLAPRPDRIARAFGLATIAGALVAIARALRASGALASLPLF